MTPAEPDFTGAAWFTSSYSDGNGASCVEVAFIPGWIGVRDTKQHGTGPVLACTDAVWSAFLTGACDGEFTRPQR